MDLENFKYNLAQLKKCNQYWDEMNPVAGGRLCAKCDKTIVDFSGMSFSEIALFMAENKQPVCGFYLPEQLRQINHTRSKAPVALGLSALMAATPANNVEKTSHPIFASSYTINSDNHIVANSLPAILSPVPDSVYLKGQVRHYDTIQKAFVPVAYASVVIKGAGKGVSTDDKGDFRLLYDPATGSNQVVLSIYSIGFESTEIVVALDGQTEINLGAITMEDYKGKMSVFYITTKKRSKLNRFWRKMTSPFRK